MTTPNNINPNGVSDGNGLVVPTESNINPNGGNGANSAVNNEGTVHVTGGVVETVSVTNPNPAATDNLVANQNVVNPNTVVEPQVAQRVVVEDSVTHQAGEGVTTGMSPSLETPDIFDNSPQAAVKTQTADQKIIDDRNVQVIPEQGAVVVDNTAHTTNLGENLATLPDGSVDVRRD